MDVGMISNDIVQQTVSFFQKVEAQLNKKLEELTTDEWYQYLMNNNPSEDELQMLNAEIDWFELSHIETLSIDFIDRYRNELFWMVLSEENKTVVDHIERYKDKIDWTILYRNPYLTKDVLDDYGDKLNWEWMGVYQDFDFETIIKYIDQFDLENININKNTNLSEKEKNELKRMIDLKMTFQ